jgi:hypothetical protein
VLLNQRADLTFRPQSSHFKPLYKMVDDYDSDGGLSDASSVTRTNVLLASIEPKLKVSTSTHTSSFAGGYPAFPSLPSSSSSSIPAESGITCGNCQAPMPLLSQIYCPMEQGENDRTLYVWACPKAACQRRAGRCVSPSFFYPAVVFARCTYSLSYICIHELIHRISFHILDTVIRIAIPSVFEHSEHQRETKYTPQMQLRNEPRPKRRPSDSQKKSKGRRKLQR